MSIKVRSPHSGVEVVIRREDVGRALRDESGRVFYVVEREDGAGCYGSKTRVGSAAEAERAAAWDRGEGLPEVVASGGDAGVHDARGQRRRSKGGLVVVVIAVGLLGGGGWWAWQNGWLDFGDNGGVEAGAGEALPAGAELLDDPDESPAGDMPAEGMTP
ncbi:hypothetical protein [Mucisphaera sp.]|uniref:hypothetical protein n=1 Tax=Mucisphaera sp. TaxID=2913024 RepID=UPI003D09B018